MFLSACHPEAGTARRGTSQLEFTILKQRVIADPEQTSRSLRTPVTLARYAMRPLDYRLSINCVIELTIVGVPRRLRGPG
jgi:hypothetical protein